MISTKHHIVENLEWKKKFDSEECDLNDNILSEGSSAQAPLIINLLEINMKNKKFSKKKSIWKDILDKRKNKFNSSLNSKKLQNNERLLSPTFSQEFKDLDILKRKNVQLLYPTNKSPKIMTSWRSPQPLKDEIKMLLRKLANERLNNSEWKNDNLPYKSIKRENIQPNYWSDKNDYENFTSRIMNNFDKTPKLIISIISDDQDEISMRDIHPNWDLDILFN